MSYNQSRLNAYYDQQDRNESVYDLFEHDVARELYLVQPHKRQTLQSLRYFVQELRGSSWVTSYEMNGGEWNFHDDVEEAVESAIYICNQWDELKTTQPRGGYYATS